MKDGGSAKERIHIIVRSINGGKTKIYFRQDTEVNWEIYNPVIPYGEHCLNTDNMMVKIGDNSGERWDIQEYNYKAVADGGLIVSVEPI
jgi:hypothetical protein